MTEAGRLKRSRLSKTSALTSLFTNREPDVATKRKQVVIFPYSIQNISVRTLVGCSYSKCRDRFIWVKVGVDLCRIEAIPASYLDRLYTIRWIIKFQVPYFLLNSSNFRRIPYSLKISQKKFLKYSNNFSFFGWIFPRREY